MDTGSWATRDALELDDPERARLILAIEDQREHLQVIEQVLAESSVDCQVMTVASTQQASDFLYRRDRYTQAQRPDLILMNMHLSDGQAQTLLREIKSDLSLRRIPTILFTPSVDTANILMGYQLQGNCYVLKPEDLSHLNQVVIAIESFWLNIVTLPTK